MSEKKDKPTSSLETLHQENKQKPTRKATLLDLSREVELLQEANSNPLKNIGFQTLREELNRHNAAFGASAMSGLRESILKHEKLLGLTSFNGIQDIASQHERILGSASFQNIQDLASQHERMFGTTTLKSLQQNSLFKNDWYDKASGAMLGAEKFAEQFKSLNFASTALPEYFRTTSLFDEMSFATKYSADIYSRIGLQYKEATKLPHYIGFENSIVRLAKQYENLTTDFFTHHQVDANSDIVISGASQEMIATGHLAEAVFIEEEERDDRFAELILGLTEEARLCLSLLQNISRDFADPLLSAHRALEQNYIDKARIVLAALREIFTHLLHYLTPKQELQKWIEEQGREKEFIQEGKPTRKARLYYICRHIQPETTLFVKADVEGVLEMMNFLNKMHKLKPDISDEILRACLLRVELNIIYLLNLPKSNQTLPSHNTN